jgi:hypothetical protein
MDFIFPAREDPAIRPFRIAAGYGSLHHIFDKTSGLLSCAQKKEFPFVFLPAQKSAGQDVIMSFFTDYKEKNSKEPIDHDKRHYGG